MSEAFEKLMDDLQRTANHLESIEHVENAEAVEKAIDILHMIHQWTQAYPEDIFRPVDWEQVHRALRQVDVSGTAIAADCMRYVVTRMAETIEKMA